MTGVRIIWQMYKITMEKSASMHNYKHAWSKLEKKCVSQYTGNQRKRR